MKLLRGTKLHRKLSCVLSIGTFDGVHLGHQSMLNFLKEQSKKLNIPSVVLCFEPHPKEFFRGDNKPHRLMNLREKLYLIEQLGIDYVWCLSFNKRLALLNADEFVDDILLQHLDIKEIVVGEDFKYGHKRQGNIETLHKQGQDNGFTVHAHTLETSNQHKISSTAIRGLLSEANFAAANKLLGHDYFMMGRVVHGQKRGRQIGVPTANIQIKPNHRPLHGVYAVSVTLPEGQRYPGIANIGYRPTVDGQAFLLEAHLFGFNGDLYDKRLKVTFLDKIRDEKKFDTFDDLIAEIQSDLKKAKHRLNIDD